MLETESDNPFRYCGEYYDAETGLIYLRNRYYNPATGRFITEDPVKDGLNWYVYCANNPVMFMDPWGLFGKNTALRLGTYNNPDVVMLQKRLNELGHVGKDGKILKVDGNFGPNTDYAVREYQRVNGLDVDGSVGPITWKNLGLSFSSNLPLIGEKNSTGYIYNPDGTVKQKRQYGPDGKAQTDIDYNHGGVGHEFPHEHEWDWSTDPPGRNEKPINQEPSKFVRAMMITGGTIIIIGTIAEDFASGGAGISNDAQTIQQGVEQILKGFK